MKSCLCLSILAYWLVISANNFTMLQMHFSNYNHIVAFIRSFCSCSKCTRAFVLCILCPGFCLFLFLYFRLWLFLCCLGTFCFWGKFNVRIITIHTIISIMLKNSTSRSTFFRSSVTFKSTSFFSPTSLSSSPGDGQAIKISPASKASCSIWVIASGKKWCGTIFLP